MDIENMHPFCLPFSLCHESAASSNDSKDAKSGGEKYCSNNNNTSLNNNNIERSRSRSKGALSPLDDLFDGSNLSPPMSRSVFQEECLADSSVFAGDSSSFHALHLDMDMDIESAHEHSSPRLTNFEDDDWFAADPNSSSHDCLIFSPAGSSGSPATARNNKSHSVAHSDSQVFHIVDPIAIKSSPTLAQLNLNSNDDPTDALWGDTGVARASSCVAASAIVSNSTSILPSNLHHSGSDLHPTCTHLHNSCLGSHHSLCNHQHHTHQAGDYSTHPGGSHSPMCHQLYHDHVGVQSTCLAVAPFRKRQELYRPDLIANHIGCCVHQQHTRSPSLPIAATNHRQQQTSTAGQSVVIGETRANPEQADKARCASPAPLVTSSCSPLSSSGSQNPKADGRVPENKLKENIEYLTVLLCNGSNKLEKPSGQLPHHIQQPSSISSTIVKSYSTLAQSLSTEPKLLLSQHPNNGPLQSNYYTTPSTLNTQQPNRVNINCHGRPWPGTNEALPQSANHLQQQHWFKGNAIESSISAADSTAEAHQPPFSSTSNGASVMEPSVASRTGEMKVLSSLLSSNTDRAPSMTEMSPFINVPQMCATWPSGQLQASMQPMAQPMGQMQHQPPMNTATYPMSHQHCPSLPEAGSIPPNGRPITLTPLMSNNVMIGQRQSPKPRASKVPTFAQPASPSASSTTSSSGNTEITPSSLLAGPGKRQKSGAPSTKSSDRSGRPSSLSTECSLSSHDEGFSSQVDQDDCMNSMRDDSEDDSDVDSDDESFYGDYTNNDLIGASISDNPDCKWTLSMGRTRRNGQRRFFWQYNVQSKGPKGTRVASADGSENPFVLPEASDPVFSNDCQIEGVKHSGKARRGDGNDLTPNPRKLLMIGLELKKLSKIINELAPVTDLPVNARNKTRKEKNKLASRACRLKKKAQHEANKIKLFGLQREHQQVVMAVYNVRKVLRESLASSFEPSPPRLMNSNVKGIIEQCSTSVAGKTSDYVNSVLEKVVSGFIDGGLQT